MSKNILSMQDTSKNNQLIISEFEQMNSTTKAIETANDVRFTSTAGSVIHPPVIQGQKQLTGRDALIQFLLVMGYKLGDEVQVCVNQKLYYQCSVTESGLAITAIYRKWHETANR